MMMGIFDSQIYSVGTWATDSVLQCSTQCTSAVCSTVAQANHHLTVPRVTVDVQQKTGQAKAVFDNSRITKP
jgi:hypothetical protein